MAEGIQTVGGYELRNCVATGSSTQIWEVNEVGSTAQLAMKLLLPDAHKEVEQKAILKHEFKVGRSLDHPSFLKFYKIEVNRDHGFFVMDYFRSPSLKSQITSSRASVQSCFKKLSESLCLAYQYLHDQGWLHRDVKPDNILVNKTGEARVIDFSLSARAKGKLAVMLSGKQKAIQGTRTYIAPETILKKAPTFLTDQYSLGVTFYEVLTGVPPFAGTSPNDLLKKHIADKPQEPSLLNPNVTPELDRIIVQMLAKKPDQRFGSMQEVASALRGIKPFKEDPVQLQERQQREAKEKQAASVDKRLDSRADAERVAMGIEAPMKPKKRAPTAAMLKEMKKLEAEKQRQEQKKGLAGQPQQPMMPGFAPGYMPGMMPMQMPYGQAMPQMPYPGSMAPGMYPPAQYPGQPMPGQPMPGQMMPGQMMPGQQVPGQPMPGQQVSPQHAPGQHPSEPQSVPTQSGPAATQQQKPPQQQAPQIRLPLDRPEAPRPAPEAAHLEEATADDLAAFMEGLDVD
ncbi:MAG: protein kinase [Planctomycetaceae bacterium]